MTDLGEEARAALTRAAKMAGDDALAVDLARLVEAYRRERSSAAPTRGQLHHRLRDTARLVAKARRRLVADPWVRAAVEGVSEPLRLELDRVELLLGGIERRARVGTSALDPGDRSSADRCPGSPRWRMLWTLATLWSDRGRNLGVGPSGKFLGFASEVFAAAGEEIRQRAVDEVVKRHTAAHAGSVTASAPKTRLASSAA